MDGYCGSPYNNYSGNCLDQSLLQPPQNFTADSYYKVSDSDFLPNGSSEKNFLSWIGCTLRATDSWSIYCVINSTEKISGHVQLHWADLSDVLSNDATGHPWLLFTGNFNFADSCHKVTFYLLYMYNETLSGNIANKPINGFTESYRIALVNSTYLSPVAAIFSEYAPDITYDGHLTTTLLIRGSHGSYIFNSYMYTVDSGGVIGNGTASHGDWPPHTPQYVMSYLGTAKNVQKGTILFMEYRERVQ